MWVLSVSEIALYNQTNGLHIVTHRPVGPPGLYIYWTSLHVGHSPISSLDGFDSSTSVFYLINIIFNIIQYMIWSKFNWVIRIHSFQYLVWAAIFEFGFYFVLLYYYLAGLFEISVCPKGSLLWPLVDTEKVGSTPLAPDWYRVSHLLLYYFLIHK
jgi:hypothetical protein